MRSALLFCMLIATPALAGSGRDQLPNGANPQYGFPTAPIYRPSDTTRCFDESLPDDKRVRYCKAALASPLAREVVRAADTLAAIYEREGDFTLALENYHIAQSLNANDSGATIGRCRTEAIAMKDVGAAAMDCDAAAQAFPDDPAMLEARGILRFRQNRTDAALGDFNAALAHDGKRAYALYMRSVIERRGGNAAAADSDTTAAVALDANVKRALGDDGPAP